MVSIAKLPEEGGPQATVKPRYGAARRKSKMLLKKPPVRVNISGLMPIMKDTAFG